MGPRPVTNRIATKNSTNPLRKAASTMVMRVAFPFTRFFRIRSDHSAETGDEAGPYRLEKYRCAVMRPEQEGAAECQRDKSATPQEWARSRGRRGRLGHRVKSGCPVHRRYVLLRQLHAARPAVTHAERDGGRASLAGVVQRGKVVAAKLDQPRRKAAVVVDPAADLRRIEPHHQAAALPCWHQGPRRIVVIRRGMEAEHGSGSDADMVVRHDPGEQRASRQARPVDDDALT